MLAQSQTTSAPRLSQQDIIGIAVGLGGLVVIAGVVGIVCCLRKRCQPSNAWALHDPLVPRT